MVARTETLTRPNGKLYRPRRKLLYAHAWENDGYDEDCGVIVLGTLDVERARELAVEMCRYWYDMAVAADPAPVPGWWRDGFWYGERRWAYDDLRGAPGVMFWAERRAPANRGR